MVFESTLSPVQVVNRTRLIGTVVCPRFRPLFPRLAVGVHLVLIS
jgi:hypothetical protein